MQVTMRTLTALVYALVVVTAFLVAVLWEFQLEGWLFPWSQGQVDGTTGARWRDVLASTGLVVVAILVPFLIAVRAVSDHRTLAAHVHLAAKVFQNTSDAVMITDARGQVQAVNDAFTQVTGLRARDVLGRNPRVLRSGRHDKPFYDRMWFSVRETGRWQGEIWNRRKSGEIFPAWETITAIKDERQETTHYVAVFSDISALKRADERMAHLAHYDALTDLPNRVLFDLRLEHALEQARRAARRVAVVFVDLDRFKPVNDELGHGAGDRVLHTLAWRLHDCVRESDTVARIGGDEFCLVLEGLGEAREAERVAEKLVAAACEPVTIDGRALSVGASVGISIFPEDGMEGSSLLAKADEAMYRAKALGGGTHVMYAPKSAEEGLAMAS